MRYVVFGAGAIGGAIGGRLFEHGHDVVLIARGGHHEALTSRGLVLRSPEGTVTLTIPTVDSPAQLEFGDDVVVVLAVKGQDTTAALEALTATAPPELAVVCAQNGVVYEDVFGWRFEAWGPPGFYRIHTGTDDDPGIEGALHDRHEPLDGKGMRGFECTVSVDDLADIKVRVIAHGGTVTMDEFEIPTVGTLVQFRDTEGNVGNAMRYLSR